MPEIPRLGEQLILLKMITPQQLQTALKIQENDGGRLGPILISIGYVTRTGNKSFDFQNMRWLDFQNSLYYFLPVSHLR